MADVNRAAYFAIFIILAALTARDFFQGPDAAKMVRPPKLKSGVGPKLRIEYCFSCGYKKAFEQYQGMLAEKYPRLTVEGDNYKPPCWRQQLCQIIGILKLVLIGFIISSFDPFPFLGQDSPGWYCWMIQNKLYACLMIFFICNAAETQLISTGAFEIFLNDVPIWSKIETGRIPSPPELFQTIDAQLKLTTGG